MKVRSIQTNARTKEFIITTGQRRYAFPFACLDVRPSSADPVVCAEPDPDTGCEAFTYHLRSGKTDTVHLDAVLHYNQDPSYLREQTLYKLTIEARAFLRRRPISKRALIRRLRTSPTQLYRLLDPTCYGKTIDQMLRLLHVLGACIEIRTRAA